MKKLLLVVTISILLVSTASAGRLQNNAGCGLGTLFWGDVVGMPNGGVLIQLLATTTNHTLLFNQGFGMSSGTLGCQGNIKKIVGLDNVIEFVSANMDELAKDIAVGSGETLTSLAAMMEIQDVAAFSSNLQSNFSVIFPNSEVQSSDVVLSILEVTAA